MGQLVSWLSGASSQANTVGGFYTNAAGQIVDAAGSPAASTFIKMQNRALQPQFTANNEQLAATEAAKGITSSGAARNDYGNLALGQSSQIAGADAPLYSQALSAYDSIIGAMPGAQTGTYNNAIDQFYKATEDAASAAAGMPPSGGSSPTQIGDAAPSTATYNPSSGSYTTSPGYYGSVGYG